MSPRKALAHIFPRAIAAAAASAILLGSAVQAKTKVTEQITEDGRVQRTAYVPYGDLDLTSTAGTKTLEGRLASAVHMVCGPASYGTISTSIDYRACLTEARSSGKQAMVTLIARAQSGERFAENAAISVGG